MNSEKTYAEKNAEITQAIIRHRMGNPEAFSDLYELTSKSLYAYARKLENENSVNYCAEDLLQDTYVQIMTSLDGLQEPNAFMGWAKIIMKNILMQKARRSKREVDLSPRNDEEAGFDFFDQLQETDREWLPGEELERQVVREIVKDALDQLPPKQRDAMHLYYNEEKSVKEIAVELDIPEGTVKSRLDKGRANLQEKVEAYEKKHDVRLHAILGFPFLSGLFKEYAAENAVLQHVKAQVLAREAGQAVGAVTLTGVDTGGVAGTATETAAGAVVTEKAGGGGFLKTAVGKFLIGALAGTIAVGGGLYYVKEKNPDLWSSLKNPFDVSTVDSGAGQSTQAQQQNLPEYTTIGLNDNIAGKMKVGGESWFAFTPESTGSYCFYVDMSEEFDAEALQLDVYQNSADENGYIFGGLLSEGKEDGSLRFYFTMDGILLGGDTYYICFNWMQDFGLNDVHLMPGEGVESFY